MSIYSGFATRQLEETYDQLLQDLFYVFQKRILKFYKNQATDQSKFCQIILDIYTKLHQMQKHKYLQPNFSASIIHLIKYFQKNGKIKREKDSIQKNSRKQKSQKQYQKQHKQRQKLQQKQVKKTLWVKLPTREQQSQHFNELNHRIGKIKHQSILKRELSAYQYQINPQKQLKKLRSASTTLYATSVQKNKKQNQINQRHKLKKIEKIPQKRKQKIRQKQEQRSYQHLNFDKIDTNRKKQHSVQSSRLSQREVPQLVKQYIDQTNKTYMKSFRKRKIKLDLFKKGQAQQC